MKVLQSHIVPEGIGKIRLSDYTCGIFDGILSRKGVKKAIQRKAILVNGEPASTGRWVVPGQKIDWVDLELQPPKIFQLKLKVIFEDEHLAVIFKPAGIRVSGNVFRTIQNALLFNLKKSSAKNALRIPQPVHRLDAPTSGLLLVAKTSETAVALSRQFEMQTVQKKYQAIVIGDLPQEGNIEKQIEEKPAHTYFQKIKMVRSLKNEWLSGVDLFPRTGRTHQLRIHLSSLGFPILGDQLYGKEGLVLRHKGLFLCAVGLTFQHPLTKENLSFKIQPPQKFETFLERENRRWKKYF